jgi:putative hemolysin
MVVSHKGRMLALRQVRTEALLHAAQELRYRVFYEEMGATPSPEMASVRRDFDHFDAVCDHIIVVDEERVRLHQVQEARVDESLRLRAVRDVQRHEVGVREEPLERDERRAELLLACG